MSIGDRSGIDRLSPFVYAAVFGTALLMRTWQFIGADSIAATSEYDDGVYLSSAMSLLHGSWPFTDFVMVHPPGITVLLLPFAGIAHIASDQAALVAAHLLWMVIGALTATFVAVLARPWGVLPSLVAGLTYATWAVAVLPERTLNQAAVINLLVVLAVFALSRPHRRLGVVAAGVLLGLAMTVKIWAIVPFALLGCWLLLGRGRRPASQLMLGGVASVAAICLPFFVRDPASMWHQVITTQRNRPRQGLGLLDRSSVFFDGSPSAGSTLVASLVLVTCVVLVLPSIVSLIARTSTNVEVDVIIAITAIQILVLTTSPTFYPHYAIWVAPGLALGAGGLLRGVPRHVVVRWGRPALAALAIAVTVSLTQGQSVGQRPIPSSIRDAVREGDCVWSSEATLLIQARVLERNLERECPFTVDAYGTMLSQPGVPRLDRGGGSPESRSARWQRSALSQLLNADVLIIGRRDRRNLDEQSFTILRERFRYVVGNDEVQVYRER